MNKDMSDPQQKTNLPAGSSGSPFPSFTPGMGSTPPSVPQHVTQPNQATGPLQWHRNGGYQQCQSSLETGTELGYTGVELGSAQGSWDTLEVNWEGWG